MSAVPEIGQIIGKYRLTAQIGQGGMGVVFLAEHLDLGRPAAIKLLLPEFSRNKEIAARFRREARAASLVQHPGIVTVFELGELENGTPYFAMEYIEGETLFARVRKAESTPSGRLGIAGLRPLRQVASILAAVHEAGLIHRDLKPGNIMLVRDLEVVGGERARLLDFGIAKARSRPGQPGPFTEDLKTQAGMLLGTPEYMAPELWEGRQILDEKVDVYALGVIIYLILTGRLPFVGESAVTIGILHLSTPPLPLTDFDSTLRPAVIALVDSMLAKRPEQRPDMPLVVRVLGEALELSGHSGLLPVVLTGSLSTAEQVAVPAPPPQGTVVVDTAALTPPDASSKPEAFVPSDRPARPEATTERPIPVLPSPPDSASQAPSVDSASYHKGAPDSALATRQKSASSARPEQRDEPESAAGSKHGRKASALLAGVLITLAGVGLWLTLRGPTPPAAVRDFLAGSPAELASPADLASPSPPIDLASTSPSLDLAPPSAPPDLSPPSRSKPQRPPVPAGVGNPNCIRQLPQHSCILTQNLEMGQETDILKAFEKSDVRLCAGERVVIEGKYTGPEITVMPPALSSKRELLKHTLGGRFRGQPFPPRVEVQCRFR